MLSTRKNQSEDNVDDDAVEEEQPDWVDVYAGQNQRYEGVEKDFDYDDGGEQYDWSSISISLPEGKDPKKWKIPSSKLKNRRLGALNNQMCLH